jgi:hypothetical protein
MATDWKAFNGIIGSILGVFVGWMLRYLDEVFFGAKLKIDYRITGNKDENATDVYIKFRVQNVTKRRVAKSTRAYLVELHKMSNGRVVSENLLPDSFQLPWAGYSYEARDIPAKVNQYVDLVHFSKASQGWIIATEPWFPASLTPLADHRGTYRFTVVVAGEAIPQTAKMCVDYNGDWHNVTPPYDCPT